MSGIFGQISLSKLQNNQNIFKMRLWNSLYGRNAEDIYSDELFFLGCCYDGDMDIEGCSPSPILKEGSSILAVIDGVVYNREKLADALKEKGISFDSKPADNLLLFSYINAFGIDSLKNVNGDFSGVIYDTSKNSVVLFRDHMGVRPLFYYAKNGLFAFSTDIRSLLSTDNIPAELSKSWLYKTICGLNRVCNKETEYEDIYCVVPSTYLTIDLSSEMRVSQNEYWAPRRKKVRFKTEQEYFDKLRELITEAIKIRAERCPGKVGSELSGGLDSSVISIILNRLGANAVYYSWSPSPEVLPLVKDDERLDIAELCKQENITCNYGSTKLRIYEDSDIFKESQRLLGDNFVGNKGIMSYLFPPYCNTVVLCETSNFMREHGVKMVFTGHGGDEGVSHRCDPYEIYFNHEYLSFFKYMWNNTKRSNFVRRLAAFVRDTSKKIHSCKKNADIRKVSPVSEADIINSVFAKEQEHTTVNVFDFAYSPAHYITNGGVRPRFDNVALYGAYSNVRYVAPYLDYNVIDYALSIPRHLYIKGSRKRYIFRETFKSILPESIYRLRVKTSASIESIECEKPDYSDILKKAIKNSDESVWGKYLDFDKLNALCKKPDDSEEIIEIKKDAYHTLITLEAARQILDSIKALKF